MEKTLISYPGFVGIDMSSSPEDMKVGSVRDAINVDFSEKGAAKARHGFREFPVALGALDASTYAFATKRFISPFYSKMLDIYYLMVQAGASLFRIDSSGVGIRLATDLANITSALTYFSPSLGKDVWIFATDDGILRKYDGTSITSLITGDTTKGKYLALHKDRLMVAGDPAAPDVIHVSAIGDPEDFSEGLSLRNPTWEGDILNGIVEMNEKLYGFMRGAIQIVQGTVLDDFTMYTTKTTVGAISPNAIAAGGDYITFVGSNKIAYFFDGGDLMDISSERINKYFDNLDTTNVLSIRCFNYGNQTIFTLPQSNGTTVTLLFDVIRQTWTRYDLGPIGSIGTYLRNNFETLVIGRGMDLVEMVGSQAIDFAKIDNPVTIELRPIGIENSSSMKKWKKLFLNCYSTRPITIEYSTEGSMMEAITFTPTKRINIFPLNGLRGRMLNITIKGGYDFYLESIDILAVVKPAK